MTTTPPPRRGRGRPRTPGAEERILTAALEEYGEHGWSGFTMDGVARRAGVGKSTVYLRWHDKDALLTEAVHREGRNVADVDTGTLRGDLELLARNVFRNFAQPDGWANFRVVLDTASANEPLGRFSEEVSAVHREIIETMFRRATERGEPHAAVEPLVMTDLIYGAALFYSLGRRLEGGVFNDAETETRVHEVVEIILTGLSR